MRTPEQRRTLRTLGYAGIACAMIAALAMIASGCTASKGASGTDSTARGPQFDPLKFGLGLVQDALRSGRLAASVTKDGDRFCVDIGLADSSGRVWIGTGSSALIGFDPVCFEMSVFNTALTKSVSGPPAPRDMRVLPLRMKRDEADTSGEAHDVLIREGE